MIRKIIVTCDIGCKYVCMFIVCVCMFIMCACMVCVFWSGAYYFDNCVYYNYIILIIVIYH